MNGKILVFQRKENGKLKKIEEYDNPKHFASVYFEHLVVTQFADSTVDRRRRWDEKASFLDGFNVYAKVAFTENDKIIPVSQLVGYSRKLRKSNYSYWDLYRFNTGRKKKAYGGFRNPRTTQELRWCGAWDDEEFAPRVRRSRRGHNLPNAWDDYIVHNEKGWKRQSKRKHQWREKTK